MIEYLIFIAIICIIVLLYKMNNYKNNLDASKNNIIIYRKQSTKQPIKQSITRKKKVHFKNKKTLKKKEKNDLVYLDISVDGQYIDKIIIKLYSKIVPLTCNNFRTICETKKYKNSIFHRIIHNFMIQGGELHDGNTSIYGAQFEDENFRINHNKPYLLSMANSGPNTNGTQFFITTSECEHLNGKHVVFGEVVDGFKLVDKLNNVDTNSNDKPNNNIYISDCGIY